MFKPINKDGQLRDGEPNDEILPIQDQLNEFVHTKCVPQPISRDEQKKLDDLEEKENKENERKARQAQKELE